MKKIYLLLIFLIVSTMAVSAVSATEFETKDFDGAFTIDVPKNASFVEDSDGNGPKVFFCEDIGITIVYFKDPAINNTSAKEIPQTISKESNYAIAGTEGNVTTLTSNEGDGCIMFTYDDGIYVTVSGTDKELIKSMIGTVKFK